MVLHFAQTIAHVAATAHWRVECLRPSRPPHAPAHSVGCAHQSAPVARGSRPLQQLDAPAHSLECARKIAPDAG